MIKEDYFKDGESVIDSIFAEWETQIKKSKDKNLNITFFELKKSFTKFQVELMKSGCKGYFSND